MKSYSEALLANVPVTMPIAGRVFYLKESSGGEVLSVELVRGFSESSKIERVGKGLRLTPATPFSGVRLTASANTNIEFIITDGDVDIKFSDDEIIIGNTITEPVPVMTPPGEPLEVAFVGTLEPVLGVVTVDNTDAEAIPVQQKIGTVFDVAVTNANADAVPVQQQALSTIDDKAPVTVGTSATALVSDATLKRLRIRNSHATAVIAIGGAGVTLANGAVQLQPGDVFLEEDAAGADWYAISDTAGTVVQVQGLK